jgi:transglutaminase-like putative cysteine protease
VRLTIRHETVYHYSQSVKQATQLLRLTPRREPRQSVRYWRVRAPGRRVEQLDAYGNVTHLLTLDEPHTALAIAVEGEVEIIDEPELGNDGALNPLAYLAPTRLTTADAAIRALAADHLRSGPVASRSALQELADAIHDRVAYRPGATDVEETAAEALARGQGVCQDHAHVLIACCRAAGVPARYVSGYFCSGSGTDLASHAWVDVWLVDDQRWRSVDVTHRRPAGTAHCRLAVGRDYLDAAPVRGIRRGGGEEQLAVRVQISGAAQ